MSKAELEVLGSAAGSDVAWLWARVKSGSASCPICKLSIRPGSIVVVVAIEAGATIAHLRCVEELESLSAFTEKVEALA